MLSRGRFIHLYESQMSARIKLVLLFVVYAVEVAGASTIQHHIIHQSLLYWLKPRGLLKWKWKFELLLATVNGLFKRSELIAVVHVTAIPPILRRASTWTSQYCVCALRRHASCPATVV